MVFVYLRWPFQEFCTPNFYRTMLDEGFQEQCRRFRSFSKQAEKFISTTNLNDDNPSTKNRRTRPTTTLRSSLSLCFTSSFLTSQIDFSWSTTKKKRVFLFFGIQSIESVCVCLHFSLYNSSTSVCSLSSFLFDFFWYSIDDASNDRLCARAFLVLEQFFLSSVCVFWLLWQ